MTQTEEARNALKIRTTLLKSNEEDGGKRASDWAKKDFQKAWEKSIMPEGRMREDGAGEFLLQHISDMNEEAAVGALDDAEFNSGTGGVFRATLKVRGDLTELRTPNEALYGEALRDIWDSLANRATSEAQAEGMAITPLLARMFIEALGQRSAVGEWEQIRMKRVPETPPAMGGGLDEAWVAFLEWTGTEASAEEVEKLFKIPDWRRLWPFVLERSPAVVDPGFVMKHAEKFFATGVERVLNNPHLTQEGFEAIASIALHEIDSIDSRFADLFPLAARKGWKISDGQILQVRTAVALEASAKQQTTATHNAAKIFEIANNEKTREEILQARGTYFYCGILGAMLQVTQGPQWVGNIRDLLKATDSEDEETRASAWQNLAVALQVADSWNTQSVRREDLVECIAHRNPEIRQKATVLMAQINPGKSQGRRARDRAE